MEPSFEPLRIGVSACLLGQAVRYDGGHKRDAFVTELLGPFVQYESVRAGVPKKPSWAWARPANHSDSPASGRAATDQLYLAPTPQS